MISPKYRGQFFLSYPTFFSFSSILSVHKLYEYYILSALCNKNHQGLPFCFLYVKR